MRSSLQLVLHQCDSEGHLISHLGKMPHVGSVGTIPYSTEMQRVQNLSETQLHSGHKSEDGNQKVMVVGGSEQLTKELACF